MSPGIEAKKGDKLSVRDDVSPASNPIGVTCAKSSALPANLAQQSTTAAVEERLVEETGLPRPTKPSDPGIGAAVRPEQARVALLVIILAGLSCPTMSSRKIMFVDQALNSRNYVDLQETAWFIFLVFLVVLVWEMVKWCCGFFGKEPMTGVLAAVVVIKHYWR